MKKFSFLISIGIFILVFSCKNTSQKPINLDKKTMTVKYAKGFQIIKNKETILLVIKQPYQNSSKVFEYTLSKNSAQKNDIHIPVSKIVVTSTTHIPMIELLNETKSIVGFPNVAYVSSEKTRQRIDNGFIKEIGKENRLNTEILLNLAPELVVGYSIATADRSLEVIKKSGIPVIYNGDWLETSPLGRAEWIRFFGVLFDKQMVADSIFKTIEDSYQKIKKMALNSNKKPTVFSGAVMSKDIWNLPAGDSFVAQFLKDANLDYLWKNTSGKGSLSLSFESVFEKAKNATYWIAPGYFSSKEEMLRSNKLYSEFNAFKNDKIYTPTLKKGKTGGVLYYELAPTRPDLVLKDLIKITQPELFPNYQLTFFEKMQ